MAVRWCKRRLWLTIALPVLALALGAFFWSHSQQLLKVPVYRYTQLETKALNPTGRDLRWTSVNELDSPRLFLSDHPEYLDQAWPGPKGEGRLWIDEATGEDRLEYQVFVSHGNLFDYPIHIGLLVENLSASNTLTVTGQWVSTSAGSHRNERKYWHSRIHLGLRNSYADLSGEMMRPLKPLNVEPLQHQPFPWIIHAWRVPSAAMLGAHLRLSIRRTGGAGPVHCRLATAWARQQSELIGPLTLIPKKRSNPRGSWPFSEFEVSNADDPFDLAADNGKPVRWIRLCQPQYQPDGSKSYDIDIPYTRERSFNPDQALTNNGAYGARVHPRLVVKNSGKTNARVAVHLRYADERIKGCYVGAVTTFRQDQAGKWIPDATRAVQLSMLTFPAEIPFIQRTIDERRIATRPLAVYPVKAGGEITIPLTLMHDFPAMLPLAIVLRKVDE